MKKCNCCGRKLPLWCFHKDVKTKDGYRFRCQSCRNEVKREQEARKRRVKFASEEDYLSYARRKEALHKYRESNLFVNDWNLKAPWEKTFQYIRQRCGTGKDPSYVNVRCDITFQELKILWYRDRAYEMKKPSIDRLDSTKDYTFDNCQYLELSKNVKKARQEEKKLRRT